MNAVTETVERLRRRVDQLRARHGWLDHAFEAVTRYFESFGPRLAAAIAYYGFFATFALGVLAYSLLAFLVEYHVDLRDTVAQFLEQNIPVVDTQQITAGRGTASLFALIALVLAGVAWVDALRSSQRLMWRLDQAPGNIVLRRGLDVVVLLVLAVLLIGSFAVAVGIEQVLGKLPPGALLARPVGWLLTIAVNLLLATALLSALPRLRISARRLLPPAIWFAVALLVLHSLGRIYIDRVQQNPAYAVVATAAGLLVYLYIFHQLVLFAAAWAATARYGRVVDLAFGSESAGTRRREPGTSATAQQPAPDGAAGSGGSAEPADAEDSDAEDSGDSASERQRR